MFYHDYPNALFFMIIKIDAPMHLSELSTLWYGLTALWRVEQPLKMIICNKTHNNGFKIN